MVAQDMPVATVPITMEAEVEAEEDMRSVML
jgi:hypothetical protein